MQVRAYKLDIIVQANDLAARTGLDVLLVYVARLIVEETVGVTHPGHTAEENPKIMAVHSQKVRHIDTRETWKGRKERQYNDD